MSEQKMIIDVVTGEVTERPFTKEEITQREIDQKNAEVYEELLMQKEEAKKNLLNKLGITEEEAKLLLS